MRKTALSASVLPAAILAVLTLGVFWSLREYGPETALRKFHRGAVQREIEEVYRVTVPNPNPNTVGFLATRIHQFAQQGARYQVRYVQRRAGFVVAEVEYVFDRRGIRVPMLYVVRKVDGQWRVDTDASIALMARGLLPSRTDPGQPGR
ncbi:MAG: hypothetical protein SNJ74_02275 [Fimbriimonadaceae bacterium]